MTIFNSVIWWGWGSVKIPLNDISTLSVTAGDTEATITWTDVWNLIVNGVLLNTWNATKLVRKVGSAPSDSSDGTLVLTETTLNQYQTNWYTDTGLTNWTTYYYKAFSVGSNWLESGSNSADVTPAPQWWQPWVNTVAYRPLNSTTTVNDMSWNNNHLTQYWAWGTFDTNCWENTNTDNYFNTPDIEFSNGDKFFMWGWYYRKDGSTSSSFAGVRLFSQPDSRWVLVAIWWTQSDTNMIVNEIWTSDWSWGQGDEKTVYVNIPHETRNFFYYTWTYGWSFSFWIITADWVNHSDNTGWNATWPCWIMTIARNGRMGWADGFLYGKISNFIIEDKERTAQEISNYYDLTKWDYWIS